LSARAIDPQLALKALEVPDSPLSPREAEVLRRFAAGDGPAATAAAALDVQTARPGRCSSHGGVMPPASYLTAAARPD